MIKSILRAGELLLLKFWVYLWSDVYMLWRRRNIKFLAYKWWDYVRFSSLELVAYEIISKKIPWNCAELWVYRGDFAAKINEIFPDKLLYLFDTFEWFSSNDLEIEKKWNFSEWKQAFTKTSVDLVLAQMKYPLQCIVKKWYFPDTAHWFTDTFCFVSLDADLYKPIYDGLMFFYPRLVKWGYIFIHDFNNHEYTWVRKAVEQFCEEQGIAYFPLTDNCGSVIISK
jgi:O-methyltransferase